MTDHPGDELQAKRSEREVAHIADLLSTIGDRPAMTEQETALKRARESFGLSRPGPDVTAPDDRPIQDEQADEGVPAAGPHSTRRAEVACQPSTWANHASNGRRLSSLGGRSRWL